MAISSAPLIPLYRVQPLPDARLQRFGVNDSQLFGKPMIQIAAPESKPVQSPRVAPHAASSNSGMQDNLDGWQMTGVDSRNAAPEPTQTSLPKATSTATTSPAPKPGSHLDVKA
jgi:hypothetical protein